MQLKSTDKWTCLLDSFAMCLDIDPAIITKELGHDGSQIIWPGHYDPYCRRGFHIDEM